jgi:hypothetical protein
MPTVGKGFIAWKNNEWELSNSGDAFGKVARAGDVITGAQLPSFTNDVVNTNAVMTVKGINGTLLTGLGAGILKINSSGIPSLVAASDLTSLISGLSGCNVTGNLYQPSAGNCIAPTDSGSSYPDITDAAGVVKLQNLGSTIALKIVVDPENQSDNVWEIAQHNSDGSTTVINRISQYGVWSIGVVDAINGNGTAAGTWGIAAMRGETGLVVGNTAAIGSLGTPTTITTTLAYTGNDNQSYDIACYLNTQVAAASTAVNFYLVWTDNVGSHHSATPYVLDTSSTSNTIDVAKHVVATGASGSSTVIGYYTTLTGTGMTYGVECSAKGWN